MLFSGVPLSCRSRGDTGDCLCEAEDRPKYHPSGLDQLTNPRVKRCGLRLLAQHDEAFSHKREHQPRTSGVVLAVTRQPHALLIKDCQCTVVIACVSHLSKKRSES